MTFEWHMSPQLVYNTKKCAANEFYWGEPKMAIKFRFTQNQNYWILFLMESKLWTVWIFYIHHVADWMHFMARNCIAFRCQSERIFQNTITSSDKKCRSPKFSKLIATSRAFFLKASELCNPNASKIWEKELLAHSMRSWHEPMEYFSISFTLKSIFIIIWCSWFTLVVVKVFHSMASVHCACNSKTKKSHRNRETGKNTHTKPKERRKEKNHFEILMQIMSHVYSSFLWNFEF